MLNLIRLAAAVWITAGIAERARRLVSGPGRGGNLWDYLALVALSYVALALCPSSIRERVRALLDRVKDRVFKMF